MGDRARIILKLRRRYTGSVARITLTAGGGVRVGEGVDYQLADAEPEAASPFEPDTLPSLTGGVPISDPAGGGIDVGPLKCTGSFPLTMPGVMT